MDPLPWVLPFVAPLGALPFDVARGPRFVASAAIVAVADRLSWPTSLSTARFGWLIAALTFFPVLLALEFGQIGPLVLAGFRYF